MDEKIIQLKQDIINLQNKERELDQMIEQIERMQWETFKLSNEIKEFEDKLNFVRDML